MKFFKTLSNSDLENAKEEFRLSRKLGDHPHLVNVVDFEEHVKYPLLRRTVRDISMYRSARHRLLSESFRD